MAIKFRERLMRSNKRVHVADGVNLDRSDNGVRVCEVSLKSIRAKAHVSVDVMLCLSRDNIARSIRATVLDDVSGESGPPDPGRAVSERDGVRERLSSLSPVS